MGVIIWGVFHPVTQVIPWGLSNHPPPFGKHILMLWLLILVSSLISVFCCLQWRVWSHPSTGGSLFMWVGAFCIREVEACSSLLLTWRGTYLFDSPLLVWTCQLWPSLVSGHIYLGVHYLPVSVGLDVTPSAGHTCSFWCPLPHHIT